MNHVAIRSHHNGLTVPQAAGDVDVDEINLIESCIGLGHGQFHVPVYGVGQGRYDDGFGAHPGQLPGHFRMPHVVANHQPDLAHTRYFEDHEIVATCDAFFIGQERITLGVTCNHFTRRIDHRRGVENLAFASFKN